MGLGNSFGALEISGTLRLLSPATGNQTSMENRRSKRARPLVDSDVRHRHGRFDLEVVGSRLICHSHSDSIPRESFRSDPYP